VIYLLFLQRTSAWTAGFICVNAIKAVDKHQSNSEFYVSPGYRRKDDECHAPTQSQKIKINWRKQEGEWINFDCICYEFQDDPKGPCVKVKEDDWTSADDWGQEFFSPGDYPGFEDGDEFIVTVDIRRNGLSGKVDGRVQLRMHKYPCNDKDCKCTNGVPTKAPTNKPSITKPPTWPTRKPPVPLEKDCDSNFFRRMLALPCPQR